MPKQTVLKPEVREAIGKVFAIREAAGLAKRWSQKESIAAIAFAAEAWFKNPAATAKGFMALGDHGFLGNASQFRQALEALPDGDEFQLAKGSGADLDLYA